MKILPSKSDILPIMVVVVGTLVVLSFVPAGWKAKIPGLSQAG